MDLSGHNVILLINIVLCVTERDVPWQCSDIIDTIMCVSDA